MSRRDVVLGFSGLVVVAAIGGGLWVQRNEAKPAAPQVIRIYGLDEGTREIKMRQ